MVPGCLTGWLTAARGWAARHQKGSAPGYGISVRVLVTSLGTAARGRAARQQKGSAPAGAHVHGRAALPWECIDHLAILAEDEELRCDAGAQVAANLLAAVVGLDEVEALLLGPLLHLGELVRLQVVDLDGDEAHLAGPGYRGRGWREDFTCRLAGKLRFGRSWGSGTFRARGAPACHPGHDRCRSAARIFS